MNCDSNKCSLKKSCQLTQFLVILNEINNKAVKIAIVKSNIWKSLLFDVFIRAMNITRFWVRKEIAIAKGIDNNKLSGFF